MKKTYYEYLIYFVLSIGLCISAWILGTHSLNIPLFPNSVNKLLRSDLNDSLIVIKLNERAFDSRLSDPERTIEIADSSIRLSKKLGYLPGVAEAYRVCGIGFSYVNNNSLAIKNYIEALRLFRQLNDHKNVARTYNNIGNLYKLNDPDKALRYFNKGVKIAGRINDEELIAGMYFNMAIIYSRKSDYSRSLGNFDTSYSIFRKLKDTVSMVMYLQNTGSVYYRMHQLDSAKSRLSRAIQTAKELNLYSTLSGCHLYLSYIYLEENEFALAEKTIAAGLIYSGKIKNRLLDNDYVRITYELALKRKNYQKALKYLALAYRNDSLLLNENQSSNIDISSRHYLQQQKIQEKELIITKQKYKEATVRWIITLSAFVLLLSVVIVSTLHFLREKRRKRNEILIQSKIASLEQKALQAMMNPHFVFNVMNSIQHFINQADARTANQVLSGFARLARKHLEICMNSTISVQEELVYLQLYLSLEKVRFSDKMNYEITIDENIDTEEISIPSMLIQPFIENAIWHGLMPKEEGGMIRLKFDLDERDLLITIVDDGIGISNSENTRKTGHISRGMALIRERISLLNRLNKRHIFIDQRQTGEFGTAVFIRIPA